MNRNSPKRWLFRSVLAVSLMVIWGIGTALAQSAAITPADIRFSEPYEITASIMEIDHGKDRLIVAEREVYAVDFVIGSEAIETVISNGDGDGILFADLERGQKVRISGMKLPDGRVIAEDLVLLPARK
jgi:hypothetical protein